jgi:hypothetical protein
VPACDCFKQVITTERSTRVLDKGEQQLEFRPPQRNAFTVGIKESARQRIERKAFEGKGCRICDGHVSRSRSENCSYPILEDTRFPPARGPQFLPKNYNDDIRSLQTSVTISPLDIEAGLFRNGLRGFADGQAPADRT